MSAIANAGIDLTGNSPWENLANAIVLQAVEDYRLSFSESNNVKNKNTGEIRQKVDREEIEKFFNSRWFSVLTSINPYKLLQELDKERELK